jgi:hypothetical protein
MTIHITSDRRTTIHADPLAVDACLAQIEEQRLQELSTLPDTRLDVVAAAYRDSVERVLEEVRIARRRVAEGLYGICAACQVDIPPARLELRPWATTCAGCGRR